MYRELLTSRQAFLSPHKTLFSSTLLPSPSHPSLQPRLLFESASCVPHNPHSSSSRASASFSQNGGSSYPPYQQPPYRHQQPSFPPPLSYPPPFPTTTPYPHTPPLPSHSFQTQSGLATCPPGVGVFWDYENCPVPVGADCAALVRRLRDVARTFGVVRSVRAYGKPEEVHARMVGKMGACGVEVVAVAAGKEMADKAIITDALLFALDEREVNRAVPPCVVVVSGDVGFAGVLAKLTNRAVTTVLLARPRKNGSKGKRGTIPAPLAQSAAVTLDWDQLILAGESGAGGESGWRGGSRAGDDGGVADAGNGGVAAAVARGSSIFGSSSGAGGVKGSGSSAVESFSAIRSGMDSSGSTSSAGVSTSDNGSLSGHGNGNSSANGSALSSGSSSSSTGAGGTSGREGTETIGSGREGEEEVQQRLRSLEERLLHVERGAASGGGDSTTSSSGACDGAGEAAGDAGEKDMTPASNAQPPPPPELKAGEAAPSHAEAGGAPRRESWAEVMARALSVRSPADVLTARLRAHMLTTLAAHGAVTTSLLFVAYQRVWGRQLRLADYGLRDVKALVALLPHVMAVSEGWPGQAARKKMSVEAREAMARRRTFSLVRSHGNLRALALVQSRLRCVVVAVLQAHVARADAAYAAARTARGSAGAVAGRNGGGAERGGMGEQVPGDRGASSEGSTNGKDGSGRSGTNGSGSIIKSGGTGIGARDRRASRWMPVEEVGVAVRRVCQERLGALLTRHGYGRDAFCNVSQKARLVALLADMPDLVRLKKLRGAGGVVLVGLVAGAEADPVVAQWAERNEGLWDGRVYSWQDSRGQGGGGWDEGERDDDEEDEDEDDEEEEEEEADIGRWVVREAVRRGGERGMLGDWSEEGSDGEEGEEEEEDEEEEEEDEWWEDDEEEEEGDEEEEEEEAEDEEEEEEEEEDEEEEEEEYEEDEYGFLARGDMYEEEEEERSWQGREGGGAMGGREGREVGEGGVQVAGERRMREDGGVVGGRGSTHSEWGEKADGESGQGQGSSAGVAGVQAHGASSSPGECRAGAAGGGDVEGYRVVAGWEEWQGEEGEEGEEEEEYAYYAAYDSHESEGEVDGDARINGTVHALSHQPFIAPGDAAPAPAPAPAPSAAPSAALSGAPSGAVPHDGAQAEAAAASKADDVSVEAPLPTPAFSLTPAPALTTPTAAAADDAPATAAPTAAVSALAVVGGNDNEQQGSSNGGQRADGIPTPVHSTPRPARLPRHPPHPPAASEHAQGDVGQLLQHHAQPTALHKPHCHAQDSPSAAHTTASHDPLWPAIFASASAVRSPLELALLRFSLRTLTLLAARGPLPLGGMAREFVQRGWWRPDPAWVDVDALVGPIATVVRDYNEYTYIEGGRAVGGEGGATSKGGNGVGVVATRGSGEGGSAGEQREQRLAVVVSERALQLVSLVQSGLRRVVMGVVLTHGADWDAPPALTEPLQNNSSRRGSSSSSSSRWMWLEELAGRLEEHTGHSLPSLLARHGYSSRAFPRWSMKARLVALLCDMPDLVRVGEAGALLPVGEVTDGEHSGMLKHHEAHTCMGEQLKERSEEGAYMWRDGCVDDEEAAEEWWLEMDGGEWAESDELGLRHCGLVVVLVQGAELDLRFKTWHVRNEGKWDGRVYSMAGLSIGIASSLASSDSGVERKVQVDGFKREGKDKVWGMDGMGYDDGLTSRDGVRNDVMERVVSHVSD
ncbi:unnamed protein product, partial [Closterium sp. NIES-65]